jgi:hypothetical protein
MRAILMVLASTLASCCWATAWPILYQPPPVPGATQAEFVQNRDQCALEQQALLGVYFNIMSMYAREGKDPAVAAYVARQAYEVVKETMLLDQEPRQRLSRVFFGMMSSYASRGEDSVGAVQAARQAYEVVKETMRMDQKYQRRPDPCALSGTPTAPLPTPPARAVGPTPQSSKPPPWQPVQPNGSNTPWPFQSRPRTSAGVG